jgi:hypothetical protein
VAVHSIRDQGGEPNAWEVKLFANISGSEEFLMQLVMEMPELVDASMIHGAQRDKLKEAIIAISVEGLMPAFEHLKKIRGSAAHRVPELNRKQLYEDFTRVLWHAYKNLMQKAAKMMETEIGFLFQKDAQFEAGLIEWSKKRRQLAQVAPWMRKQRAEWQDEMADFRNNVLEHCGDSDPAAYAGRYEPAHAEQIFDRVWHTIADILAMLVSLHLPPRTRLVEIPEEERDKVRPRRFRFAVLLPTRTC